MVNVRAVLLIAAAFAAPAAAQHNHSSGEVAFPPGLHGSVHLENDGSALAQEPFLEGLAQLHNFEYGPARTAFRRAQLADPGFVLAYWGEAMTHNHPLWAAQDQAEALAALAKLGGTVAERRKRVRSAREGQWLDALETLFGAGTKAERDRLYSDKMRALHESDPGDVDARAFYALSLLGTAGSGRDVATYMRAAALLEEAFPDNQQHPGVLHYLIHSYDDPVHAPLGLRAAQRYGAVAPGAGHALHMTSHIYLALGRWPESVEANIGAMAAVDRARAAEGLGPTYCGHYPEWQAYSLLQLERVDEARDIRDRCQEEAQQELTDGNDRSTLGRARSLYNIWATKVVRHGVDSGQWPDFAALPASTGHLMGRFWLAYGQLHALQDAGADMTEAHARFVELGRETLAGLARERPIDQQAPRWVERAIEQGRIMAELGLQTSAGQDALRAAALAEESLPVEFGPPALPKPSRELLADSLRLSGNRAGAAEAYERMLQLAPGRRQSLIGLAAVTR